MSKITEALEGLINRTEEGKLKWRTSGDGKEFLTSVDMIAVVIRQLSSGGPIGRRHQLIIANDEGVTVEMLETDDLHKTVPRERLATSEQAQDLDRLFTLARRSALDIDSTLDKLVKGLKDF